MSADLWAGYISGAAGIIIGNPLDLIKTRLQAGNPTAAPSTEVAAAATATASTAPVATPQGLRGHFDHAGTLIRGASAPILGYGALNALLFVTYNRTLALLSSPDQAPSLANIYLAGATGGLASFVVSAPTELIKCRAQVSTARNVSSWSIAKDVWKGEGIRGLYYGGGITSVRDAVGYGFYFLSYEWMKQSWTKPEDSNREAAMKIMLCGGVAGIVTWASIFPLDMVKTRLQVQVLHSGGSAQGEQHPLLQAEGQKPRLSSIEIAKHAYRTEGASVFFRGLGVCSVRAFVVNAVQWAVYEWTMRFLQEV